MTDFYQRMFGRTGVAHYGDERHPDLPWGYWLTSIGEIAGEPPLIDESGREFSSVREAFWTGRLGIDRDDSSNVDAMLEFMCSYMAIVDRRFVASDERAKDIFGGHYHFLEFFEWFMWKAGLTEGVGCVLTPEGRAVLLMLINTRSRDDRDDAVGMDWIAATRNNVRGRARKHAADMVAENEKAAARMAYRFTTDTVNQVPMIKLIGFRITPEIPVRSTLWTMSWTAGDQFARDQFYLWLVERIDRWDDWSQLVINSGTRALTEHFMRLAFCDHFVDTEADNRTDG